MAYRERQMKPADLPASLTLPVPRAILFDMDGTLTRPMLDFDAIRAEIDIRGPILEALRGMNEIDLERANKILDRHEREAAEASELNDGCRELLGAVEALGLPTAIITRNSRASVDIVLARHALTFGVLICRDAAPPKPDPRAIFVACDALGVTAADCWMIGDGSHDIEAGNAAGATTIWLDHAQPKDFAAMPTARVTRLTQITDMIRSR